MKMFDSETDISFIFQQAVEVPCLRSRFKKTVSFIFTLRQFYTSKELNFILYTFLSMKQYSKLCAIKNCLVDTIKSFDNNFRKPNFMLKGNKTARQRNSYS